jgi:hypothetical protein
MAAAAGLVVEVGVVPGGALQGGGIGGDGSVFIAVPAVVAGRALAAVLVAAEVARLVAGCLAAGA